MIHAVRHGAHRTTLTTASVIALTAARLLSDIGMLPDIIVGSSS